MSKQNSRFSFLVLAFGHLGSSAKKSLLSMDRVGPQFIFAMADLAGVNWLQSQVIPFLKTEVIFLQPDPEELEQLQLSNKLEQDYSAFGEERFIRLTAFKWAGILAAIQQFAPDKVVFSDLDVVWLKRPEIEPEFELEKDSISCQDDTPRSSTKVHYCTGIMFWPNSHETVGRLQQLFRLQKNQFRQGILTPDEPMFNFLVESDEKFENIVRKLDPRKYVIGHRFFFYFSSKKFNEIVAYHANYVVGEKRKDERMQTVILRSQQNPKWVLAYLSQVFQELKNRLKL